MTTEQIIEYLRHYNEWRRGSDAPQPNPTEVGKAIDAACEALEIAARTPKRYSSVRDLVKATAADDEQVREFDRRIEEARNEGDRPTPETDAAVEASNGQWSFVLRYTCKRLERERDEALEALRLVENERVDMANQLESEKSCHAKCQNDRDEARANIAALCEHFGAQGIIDLSVKLLRLERERDEAREWQSSLSGWGGTPEIVHDFIKGQQMRIYAAQEAERERDEARKALRELWQSADAYIPSLDPNAVERWRKIAGLEDAK